MTVPRRRQYDHDTDLARSLWLLAAFGAALFFALARHTAILNPDIPALQLTFDQAGFQAIIAQWSPEEFSRFRTHFYLDFPFLVTYGLLGYRLTVLTPRFARATAARDLLSRLLPYAAALDAIENGLHLALISTLEVPASMFLLAGIVASVKWILIALFPLGFLGLWLATRHHAPSRDAGGV